ncbi:nuclear speckle RNA-binding protein B-like [Neltuma alba]|uniref:nuclear speckle RNA-binding protein B-like n=1 Tax=Neltuma alba TaxID=207710 RepID=UPI0010A30E48|nr:nuclear speckle RNA-binding protein B-like [Prosopis alba]
MEFPRMDPTGKSPRRSSELQGPRPTPLKINKDSHKIKKPPLPPQPPPRQPIIIYTVSPKIIHTTPSDFMSLVQRLTGSHSSNNNNSSSSSNHDDPFSVANDSHGGTVSPAARFAAIEKARSSPKNKLQHSNADVGFAEGTEINGTTTSMSHGILSPGPTSLSPIPSSFFSPPSTSEPGVVSLFHDVNPVLHSSRNFTEGGGFIPSPSNYFVSPRTIDLFNTLFS